MRSLPRFLLSAIGLLGLILAALVPLARVQAVTSPITVELTATADARIQGGSPNNGFGNGFIWVGSPNGHLAYVQFDLLALPANATITNAELRLHFTGTYSDTANVEVGRADGLWEETTITWNTRPANTFNSNSQTVGATAGDIVWPVTGIVNQWHSGAQPNYGFALRGDGSLKAFHSRETIANLPPRLVVTYTVPPDDGGRPDSGDAPDSSNTLGLVNSVYSGVPGNFPTVWNGTPAGQAAGPRHANLTPAGLLGDYRSREIEADSGNDEDGRNNILNGGLDNANNDRGDDGWRNRTATFPHCQQTTLRIRVSKPLNSILDRMYLNSWIDGNRDADWNDRMLCTPENEVLAVPAYEWIIQDYYVDMTGIPAGGYVDIDVTTTTILNTTPNQSHWMRFTLSETRAIQSAPGRADGRGPHPSVGSYQFGETEDYLQQLPPPGEPGTLELDKQVITGGEPVEYAGTVTYRIRLRHNGGSEPIRARIQDMIDYPQHVLPQLHNGLPAYVVVESPTGGASPLEASLGYEGTPISQVLTWDGTLQPNSEVTFTFNVHVHPLCAPNQQTATIVNRVTARPQGGAEIADEVSYSAACPGYNPLDIEFDNVIINEIDPNDLTHVQWNGTITNSRPFTSTIQFYDPLAGGTSTIIQDSTGGPETITFGPFESKPLTFTLPLGDAAPTDDLDQVDLTPVEIRLGFCFRLEHSLDCPDETDYPQYHGEAPPTTYTPRPNDLGDAPDSSNHGGVAMLAYPGTPANFPTVFDSATGLPQGPRHVHPRPFHLGQQVSREAEADIGPDEDPANNIIPATNNPNNDRFDDSVRPGQWAFNHCQTTTMAVRVFISPQAVAWFQQHDASGYLNAWIDANRDGDWGDGTNCGGGVDGNLAAVEHIVIDYPIDVVALGAGIHTLNLPTSLVPWPAALAQQAAWARITLSEQPSNKPLQFGDISYGDGRGFATPFRTGETEDYLWRPAEDAPDLGVALSGLAQSSTGGQQLRYGIEYTNLGATAPAGGTITFTKPTQLSGQNATLLQTYGIAPSNITEQATTISFSLPALQPGESGAIVIGWEIPASQPPAGDYSATVTVTVSGDQDTTNNQATAVVPRAVARPNVAALAGDGEVWGFRETTCFTEVNLRGISIPDAAFELLVNGDFEAGLVDGDDTWNYLLRDLEPGRYEIRVAPLVGGATVQSAPLLLDVDPTLPIDPLSLTFTDSQGRIFHPPTLNWRQAATAVQAALQPGETYEIGITSCIATPNQQHDLLLPNGDVITLADTDGDGRYNGTFVFDESGSIAAPANATTTAMRLISRAGGAAQYSNIAIQPSAPGRVSDAGSSAPLADAEVTLLALNTSGAWPATALGTANPQTSDVGGNYSFGSVAGFFQIAVTRNGYQAYRSATLSGNPNRAIRLTPQIVGPPAVTIAITANGFVPAVVEVAPGSIIEWVNLDVKDRGANSPLWDSGLLAPGQSYRTIVAQPGSHTYRDAAGISGDGAIVVTGSMIMLPLVTR